MEDNAADGLKTLIVHAGGSLATAPPNKQATGQWLVLGSDKDIKRERAWAAKHLPPGTAVHGRAMLVDAILQQSIDERQGILLTVSKAARSSQ